MDQLSLVPGVAKLGRQVLGTLVGCRVMRPQERGGEAPVAGAASTRRGGRCVTPRQRWEAERAVADGRLASAEMEETV